nr:MAG TPA: endopeptidase tail [Caudoviricetes sp.]
MYQLTYDSKILFDTYMQSTAITDAKYTGKSDSVSYLDFTIAPNHPLYNTIEKDKGLVEFYSDNVLKFRGKINEIEIDDYGYKIVSCNSVLQYLNHTRVRSYSTVPGDADLTAPTSVEGYFQWLIDQHNLHVKDASERFEVGVNQGAALDKNDYILRSNDGYPTTLDEINDKVLDNLGGYLFVEYKDDRNILNLYADVHSTNSQIIDFGSNILSISYKENDDELYTVVIPRGGTPEKKEGDTKDPKPINIKNLPDNTFDTDSDIVKSGDCVYSLSATKRYGYREYYYSNNDILDPSNLLKAAVLQLRLQMSPKVTIETKAIDLSIAYPGYEQLNIGDACRVRSARHNLDDYFMLSEMELDLNDPSQTTYTFGDEYVSLVGRQSNYLKQINSSIDRNYEDVNTAMSYGKAAAKLADTANKTADAANNTAVKANDKAQKATEDAFNANTTANKAQTTATTAKSTADKAQTAAAEASKTANDAKAVANSANTAAEELKKKTVEIDKQVEAVSNAANAASAKADQVRSDLTQQVQNVKSEMDTAVKAAQTSANKAQSAADAAQKAADKANASTVDLDKSIKAVDAKAIAAKQAAAEAQSKAENVASDLDSTNAVIEQHTTELGELTTKVSNAVKKSDSALSVSTEAKQTATEASTTATSAYNDSQTALTQSTTATQTATAAKTTAESASKTASDSLKQSSAAVQTANQISTTLRTEYQTKADADKIYATQSSLKQTSDSITASVSKTYATKDALSALQNVADNAIESWRGTGVPTLDNKPASDWTTNDDKKKHSGDLYYDKATGKAYRFGSDDGVTYTWELNQDTDVTKALADAAKAQTSANNAQASATAANTAAGKAQSTANTAVSNAATAKNAADAAQSSANKAQGDVDKLKIDIPETYATKSSLTQTAESITANVESVKTTANSAVTAASKAQQTADGISVNLSKNYQTKSQADTLYATKASLKATSDSISAEVTKAQGTADGAVTAASKAQQTADAVTLNLSKNYNTKAQNDAVYATQTSLKATSDSLSVNITANAKTAQSAVDKATSLEANLNGFKTTVSQTYQPKGIGDEIIENGIPNPDQPNKFGLEIVNGVFQRTFPGREDHIDYGPNEIMHKIGPHRLIRIAIDVRLVSGKDTVSDTDTVRVLGTDVGWTAINVYLRDIVDGEWHSYETYLDTGDATVTRAYASSYVGSEGAKVLQFRNASIKDVTSEYKTYSTKSELTQTANSIKAQVTEVSKTANGAMSKATTVEQTANGLSSKITEQGKTLDATVRTANEAKSTADSNKATISQVSTTASSALTKASTVEQNLNGFKTTVSQTYGHGSNLWVNPTFDADKPQIGSLVDDVTAPNGSKVNLLKRRDHFNADTNFPVVPGHTYVITAICKHLIGDLGLHAGIWYTLQTSGHAYDTYVNPESVSNLSDGWMSATWRFTCRDGKSRGCVYFQIDNWPVNADSDSNQWYISNVTCVDVTGLQPAGDYSTKSYVDQTAKSVALGVVQNYKGADGSGLAMKSDITASEKSITSTVSSTYQTKADMKNYATQSQLTQTNDKVTIAFQNSQSVGGQNLLLKTSVPTVVTGSGAANQCVAPYELAVGSLKNLPVGMYHMQFKIKSDTAGGTAFAQWNSDPLGLGSHTKVHIGTTEQTYSVDYYITDNNYPDAKQMTVRLDNAKGNVTIREMKLEPGNSMTPWTAAPEDTINDLTNTVQNQATDIANKVSNDDYTGYVNATNKNLSDIQDSQQHLSDSVNNEIKLRESYIQFGQDKSNPYMDMGNSSSPNKMRLTNTKLSFTSNNIEVASVSNDKMRISNAEVLQSLRIGNFVWQPRSDGHMALKYSPEV